MAFIYGNFYFRIISEFLNSRVSVHVFLNVYSDSLLARTLNSRGYQFANINENLKVLTNISGSTVSKDNMVFENHLLIFILAVRILKFFIYILNKFCIKSNSIPTGQGWHLTSGANKIL